MNRLWLTLAFSALAFSQQPKYQHATMKQLMAVLHKPAMDGLSTMNKAGGPKDDAEWAQAKQHAAMLGEAAQLAIMGDHAVDQDVWMKSGEKLVTAADGAMKAAEAKDLTAWKTSLGEIGQSCQGCHKVYRKRPN
ncbi:MAG: cytochrome c [Bryobacteraceae bacterium]